MSRVEVAVSTVVVLTMTFLRHVRLSVCASQLLLLEKMNGHFEKVTCLISCLRCSPRLYLCPGSLFLCVLQVLVTLVLLGWRAVSLQPCVQGSRALPA